MLKTESLQYSYNGTNQFSFPDIKLTDGENLLILGESGIGKTTLLHLMAGLLRPKSGNIEIKGTVINKLSSSKLDRFRGRHIGLIFQRPHFVQSLTLHDNLALVQYLSGKKKDEALITSILESLGILQHANQSPHRLSQGEQQRATVALAILNSPELILADEPTSSLDDTNCKKVINLLKEQANNTGSSLVIITHDQRLKNEFQNILRL